MRRVILQDFVSLDGFAADRNGTTEFFQNISGREGDEINQEQLKFIQSIDTILLGANTYKMFVEYWPTPLAEKEPIAELLNATPKIVFSSTLKDVPWGKWNNASVVKTDAAAEVRKLKQQSGKDIVIWGSISLGQSLMKEGLIDELQLRVVPVAIGQGRTVFSDETNSAQFKLADVKSYKSGVIATTYIPVK